jgi:mRNA interferase HicA
VDVVVVLASAKNRGLPLSAVDKHNISVIICAMNAKQMKKWLEQQGATFQPGKGSHLKVYLNGKQSTLPMHGTTELGKGLEAAIKRQLGLK